MHKIPGLYPWPAVLNPVPQHKHLSLYLEYIDPFQLVGMQLNWRTEQWVALCMIIDFIAAWRFSFVLSSSSKVLTSHLKGVYTVSTILEPSSLRKSLYMAHKDFDVKLQEKCMKEYFCTTITVHLSCGFCCRINTQQTIYASSTHCQVVLLNQWWFTVFQRNFSNR